MSSINNLGYGEVKRPARPNITRLMQTLNNVSPFDVCRAIEESEDSVGTPKELTHFRSNNQDIRVMLECDKLGENGANAEYTLPISIGDEWRIHGVKFQTDLTEAQCANVINTINRVLGKYAS